MIKIYEIDSGRGDVTWDCYSPEDELLWSSVPDNELETFLDTLRDWGVDFTLYTVDWYEQHLALGRS